MAEAGTSVLLIVLVFASLFALLYVSQYTQSISPNRPRVVHTNIDDSSLSSSCLSLEYYESLFDTKKGPVVGLPSYVPQGYALQCINVSGPIVSEEDFVSFYYSKKDQEFKSKILPKIEKEPAGHPMYDTSWFPEFYDLGGIVITRSIEYIDESDPRYNDKVKHFEIERAMSDPLSDCSLPGFANGSCELLDCSATDYSNGTCDLQGDFPPTELVNGNPLTQTFVEERGSRVEGVLMYMDRNWLVYIIGSPATEELVKIAETIDGNIRY